MIRNHSRKKTAPLARQRRWTGRQRSGPLVVEELESRVVPSSLPRPDHVVLVIEENHTFSQIIGSANAPYINSLAQQGALMTASTAIEHPSQPNYLDLFSGSNQGVVDDSRPVGLPFTTPNLGAALQTAGFRFTGYSESLPSAGFDGDSFTTVPGQNQYQRKHNPWTNWTNNPVGANQMPSSVNQPFTSFPTNFSQLPNVSIVVPNEQNDMHDGTVQQADTWLKNNLDSYVQWARNHNSLLIVTWDENDTSPGNQIPTLFVGPMVVPGAYGTAINHFSVLRTVEDMFGLPAAGASSSATPITSIWQTPLLVAGADAGGGPNVTVFNADTHQMLLSFFPYNPAFTGGVRVALGDVNGDGVPDIITVAGPGGGSQINAYDGRAAAQGQVQLLFSFFAFDPRFTGGAWLAAGDVNGTGPDDIIVGADAGGGPNITVFSIANNTATRVASFFAYAPTFTGGVRVAAGDVNGDGHADIICGAGPGGGPNVTVYSGADNFQTRLMNFFAYAPTFTSGIFVGAADLNKDGHADIICGAGPGGGPNVTVFSGLDGSMLATFFPYAPGFTGGVRVAGVVNSQGQSQLLSVAGPGGGPDVRLFNLSPSPTQVDQFFAFAPAFTGGLYVAAASG